MIDVSVLLMLLLAQSFEQRGFVENQTVVYPQTGANDSGHVVDSMLVRWEASYKVAPWLTLNGAFDGRADTHRQVERDLRVSLDDRTIQRPAFAIRRLSAALHKGKFTAAIGRQFIRWGKTDILNPTDRFAPKDYLASVVDSDFLGVWAVRGTYETGGNTLDLIWQPWFTPSRTPLLNQRWAVAPEVPPPFTSATSVESGARYPGRSQFGARWNHVGSGYEYSVSYFDGFNHLPSFNVTSVLQNAQSLTVGFERVFPQLRLYGADAAVPLPWLTLKGEAAYFTFPGSPASDQYVLYVVQLERQVKEWSFVGGYAGAATTRAGSDPLRFAPDVGFAKSFVGHAGLTIDANRSVGVDGVIRGGGSYVRGEYSQAFGQHWRATGGIAWLRGDMADFLGQYHRNSYVSLVIRYSF